MVRVWRGRQLRVTVVAIASVSRLLRGLVHVWPSSQAAVLAVLSASGRGASLATAL